MASECLDLFDKIEAEQLAPCIDTYNAAIWACEVRGDWKRAQELLRLANYDNLRRQTITFDGVLRACERANESTECYETLKAMERDGVERSLLSYRCAINCLVAAGDWTRAQEVYDNAFRDGYLSPWKPGTRMIDFTSHTGFELPAARLAMRKALFMMREGKLGGVFNLGIAFADDKDDQEIDEEAILHEVIEPHSAQHELFLQKEPLAPEDQDVLSMEMEDIAAILSREAASDQQDSLRPITAERLEKFIKEDLDPEDVLRMEVVNQGTLRKLVIQRDSLAQWIDIHRSDSK
jgi:hypothetical protein